MSDVIEAEVPPSSADEKLIAGLISQATFEAAHEFLSEHRAEVIDRAKRKVTQMLKKFESTPS